MARVEKTVFISYRRKDISWALAVYQYLTSHKYDVFFDYTSLSGGDFEQVIVSNIKARAHFVLILTPTALDRCHEPGDWLRREIETAVDEKRNIIPLFFDGFSFSFPSVAEKLTGKLGAINHYNGLDIPAGYFLEAMERLRSRYLNVPLNAVLHPVPTEVRKVVKEVQVAADKALLQKQEDIKELVKPVEEKLRKPMQGPDEKVTEFPSPLRRGYKGEAAKPNLRTYGIGVGILLVVALGIFGITSLIQNIDGKEPPTRMTSAPTPTPTQTATITLTPAISLPPTPSEPFSYTLVEGDSLQSIADKFNLGDDGVLLLLEYNPVIIENNGVYFVGQTIIIPAPGTILATVTPISLDLPRGTRVEYKVLSGDTLAGIAAKFNSTVEDIISVNQIEDANALFVGQILQIPVNLVTATRSPTSTSALGVGSTMISPKDGMALLYVPAGKFTMGIKAEDALAACQKLRSDCQLDVFKNEEPPHEVDLAAFWIDQTEVTNAIYAMCVEDGECDPLDSTRSYSRESYYGNPKFDNFPVIHVSWHAARVYCSWAGRRLPTEAEWEKAARGETAFTYPWGNDAPSNHLLNYNAAVGDTTEVGLYIDGASPYGALDMAGNVWEWVADWYDASYYNNSPSSNPKGPDYGQSRVIRGGAWSDAVGVHSTRRGRLDPTDTGTSVIGFRCAMDASE